jgi:hypothetical protein
MRIGTWNVEYAYERRLPALLEVLRSNPADILILTETHDSLMPPGLTNAAHSLPRPRNWPGIRDGSRWVSIWSRFPLLERVDLPDADKERTVAAMFDAGERKLLVYGTVLPWKGDRGIFNWDEHHRVIDQQCDEWRRLRSIHADVELCVAGDFNTDMGTGGRYGTRRGIAALREGLTACGLYCATAPDAFGIQSLPHLPIDHIAVPLTWRARASIVACWAADRKQTSDHSGLIIGL